MMNMIQMVGIMVCCFFASVLTLSLLHKHINVKLGNAMFIIADVVFFFAWNVAAYQLGWLESGSMTLQNISQFTMTLIPFTLILSDKAREYCNAAIAFLWVGMFIAILVSPEHAYIFKSNTEANFRYTAESACHMLASVYGFYLIISGQVKCNFKTLGKALVCMYSVITFGVILNFLFHTRNFGMDPYGNATIYMIDIFGSFEATLVAYYLGVLLVLTLGMQIGYGVQRLVEKVNAEDSLENGEQAADTAVEATDTAVESPVEATDVAIDSEKIPAPDEKDEECVVK